MSNSYEISEVGSINIDELIERSTLKDLLVLEFNSDFDNISRTHTALKLLYNIVMEQDRKIKALERRNG